MPRKTPATKQATEPSIVDNITTTSEPVVVVAPKATRTKKSSKEASKTNEVVIEATPSKDDTPAVITEVVEENIVLENGISVFPVEQTNEFFSKLQQMGLLISQLKSEFRVLEKKWTRDLKNAQKKGYRVKRNGNPNRSPSGFVKPTRISDELATFLGKESGTEMARTAVTRDINAYIRANNLQDSDNGRKINPDSKLLALLKLQKGEELTYFNLQRYMSPHFYKNVKVEPVVALTI
jgi:chromatin remodeling complex protein RSC6